MTVSQLIERLRTLEPNGVIRPIVWVPSQGKYAKVLRGLDGGFTLRQTHRTDIKFGEFDANFEIVLDE